MAVFFRPSDITTHVCSVNNKTKGGSAFAVCEDGEQVFISPKIVDATRIEVGDLLTAYCIDNHREDSDGETRYAVRWRAIRVTVKEKFPQVAEAAPVAAPAKREDDMPGQIVRLMKQSRAWTPAQIAEALGVDTVKVSDWLRYHHVTGEYACAKLYLKGTQKIASSLYYANSVSLLRDLIDEVTLED